MGQEENRSMPVKPVPEGYATVTPYLMSSDPDRLLDFLKAAFGAEVVEVIRQDNGKIMHAEARIVDSMIMLGGASSKWPAENSSLYLYLEDVDAAYRAALSAGATDIMEPADQIYGDRMGGVKDPTGITWWLATHIEDVSPDEMRRRLKERAAAGEPA